MLAVDLREKRLLDSADIDAVNRARAPFKQWLRAGVTYLESYLIDPALAAEPLSPEVLARFQKQFALTREERDVVLKTLAVDEAEATGSMGDDTPLAVLSLQSRSLYEYFRQAFAQVTNPPIDPLRERRVMSLTTQIGPGAQRIRPVAGQCPPGAAEFPGSVAAQVASDSRVAAYRRGTRAP